MSSGVALWQIKVFWKIDVYLHCVCIFVPMCSGYWHGSVEVHSRRSSDDELIRGIDDDVQTLSCIRHENIQLFLGVCHDLHSDYISIVME